MIVDPEPYRDRDYWLKFLPSASIVKTIEIKEEKKTDLKVAWRYNELAEDKIFADLKPGDFKFDNSKVMGKSVSNQPSMPLDLECLVHMHCTDYILSDLWENICD